MTAELSAQLAAAWATTSWIEILAAVLALLYLVFAIKQWRSCWSAAFVSSCLYVWVLLGAGLYMDSALNGFYALMAVYGYWQWSRGSAARGGTAPDRGALGVTRWPLSRHALGMLAIVGASLVSSFFLRRFTPAAWPFVDSLVTWASVFATVLVARKVYENWHWFLVVDSVSLCLFFNRRLYLTMAVYVVYLCMIVVGMREWRRDLDSARAAPAA